MCYVRHFFNYSGKVHLKLMISPFHHITEVYVISCILTCMYFQHWDHILKFKKTFCAAQRTWETQSETQTCDIAKTRQFRKSSDFQTFKENLLKCWQLSRVSLVKGLKIYFLFYKAVYKIKVYKYYSIIQSSPWIEVITNVPTSKFRKYL